MARGYPDYFGYSVFPYYGDLLVQEQLAGGVLAANTETIFELAHKGVIMGGELYIVGAVDPVNAEINITIDGSGVLSRFIVDLYNNNYSENNSYLLNLTRLTYGFSAASLQFGKEISFSTQFLLEVTATALGNLEIYGRLLYTAIRT